MEGRNEGRKDGHVTLDSEGPLRYSEAKYWKRDDCTNARASGLSLGRLGRVQRGVGWGWYDGEEKRGV